MAEDSPSRVQSEAESTEQGNDDAASEGQCCIKKYLCSVPFRFVLVWKILCSVPFCFVLVWKNCVLCRSFRLGVDFFMFCAVSFRLVGVSYLFFILFRFVSSWYGKKVCSVPFRFV